MKINILNLLILIMSLNGTLAFATDYPSENPEKSPLFVRSWFHVFYEDDKSGILSEVRDTINEWEYMDQIVETYNLPEEVRGDLKERRKYITKNMLKFFERKISEEGRKPNGGTTFVALANVNDSLKPNASLGEDSDTFKFKFRGKLLQGNGHILIVNPYMDLKAEMDLSKGASLEGSKEFEDLDLTSTLNYSLKNGETTFRVDKEISEDFDADLTYKVGDSTPKAGEVSLKLLYSRSF